MAAARLLGKVCEVYEIKRYLPLESGHLLQNVALCIQFETNGKIMTESTIWWLLAGTVVALELVTGTFYLLMLALGMAAAAVAAHAGLSSVTQIVIAAMVGVAQLQGGTSNSKAVTGLKTKRRNPIRLYTWISVKPYK